MDRMFTTFFGCWNNYQCDKCIHLMKELDECWFIDEYTYIMSLLWIDLNLEVNKYRSYC